MAARGQSSSEPPALASGATATRTDAYLSGLLATAAVAATAAAANELQGRPHTWKPPEWPARFGASIEPTIGLD